MSSSRWNHWRSATVFTLTCLFVWSGGGSSWSTRADSGSEPLALLQPAKSAIKSDKSDGKSDSASNAGKKNATAMTPEREAAALSFVAQHHPELDVLLAHLKSADSAEYARAIRDISRAREKLEQSRTRDESRYEIELQQWSNQSRIDLLAARIKMAPTDEHRAQLRTLLEERVELKASLLRLERDRLEERLLKTEQQLKTLAASRDSQVDNQLRAILGSGKSASGAKPNAKQSAKQIAKPSAKSNKGSKNGSRSREGEADVKSSTPAPATKSGNASPSPPASSSPGRDP